MDTKKAEDEAVHDPSAPPTASDARPDPSAEKVIIEVRQNAVVRLPSGRECRLVAGVNRVDPEVAAHPYTKALMADAMPGRRVMPPPVTPQQMHTNAQLPEVDEGLDPHAVARAEAATADEDARAEQSNMSDDDLRALLKEKTGVTFKKSVTREQLLEKLAELRKVEVDAETGTEESVG